MKKNIQINLKEDISKKTNKPYKYLQIVIGDWTTRVFVSSKFELEYIEKYLSSDELE